MIATTIKSRRALLSWLTLLFVGHALPLHAGNFEVLVTVTNTNIAEHAVVTHAVVTLAPLFEHDGASVTTQTAQMKQREAMFQPFVLSVAVNTPVSFPNFDQFRHQVYSYSKPKRFELRLYGKEESKHVVFDTAGVVVLGCNIHNNMLTYIYITHAPYYAVTDENGMTRLANVKNGTYQMTIWHPDQKDRRQSHTQRIVIHTESANLKVTMAMRSIRRVQSPPEPDDY